MKMYGRKFARRSVDRRVRRTNETRDAVLWSIDWTNYQASVKIQGSNEFVIAHFPRNWKKRPYWLKEGNAVAIRHRSGARGYVEVVGEGRAIPGPVAGGAIPSIPTRGTNGVITGLEVHQTRPTASTAIVVESGTYRIDNVIYATSGETVSYVTMNDPAEMTMGSMTGLGTGDYTFLLPDPPVSGEYRYYAIAVAADGILDLISGEASATPTKPSIPANHIQVGEYIFQPGGESQISDYYIGIEWQAPFPASVGITFPQLTNDQFPWNVSNNYPETNALVTVRDQYGVALGSSSDAYLATFEMAAGSGQVWSGDYGDWTNGPVTQSFGTSGAYTFKYRRDQTVTESPPIFKITIHTTPTLTSIKLMTLLDAAGDPII